VVSVQLRSFRESEREREREGEREREREREGTTYPGMSPRADRGSGGVMAGKESGSRLNFRWGISMSIGLLRAMPVELVKGSEIASATSRISQQHGYPRGRRVTVDRGNDAVVTGISG